MQLTTYTSIHPKLISLLVILSFSILFFNSCSESNQIEVKLTAQDVQENRGPRWSPYGQKLPLTEKNMGLETELKLGSLEANVWAIRMTKTDGNEHYNTLFIDHNQNGDFEDSERIDIEPSESRGKMWSSFKSSLQVSVTDPWTGKEAKNIYPLSLWYVFDPNEESPENVIRFSRNGWMEGTALVEGVEASVLLAESVMDGVIDTADSWAIAPKMAPKELYDYRNNRSVKNHAWLNDHAYRIVEVHPSGLQILLEPFDPGITRVEESEKMDIYAPDKKAVRSGGNVAFEHDFNIAKEKAKAENKNLFIDFETTWCGPCKIMDKLVYTADSIVKATENIIAVKVDGDEHPDLVKRFEVSAYPTLILVSPEGDILQNKVGYQSVKQMTAFFLSQE